MPPDLDLAGSRRARQRAFVGVDHQTLGAVVFARVAVELGEREPIGAAACPRIQPVELGERLRAQLGLEQDLGTRELGPRERSRPFRDHADLELALVALDELARAPAVVRERIAARDRGELRVVARPAGALRRARAPIARAQGAERVGRALLEAREVAHRRVEATRAVVVPAELPERFVGPVALASRAHDGVEELDRAIRLALAVEQQAREQLRARPLIAARALSDRLELPRRAQHIAHAREAAGARDAGLVVGGSAAKASAASG